MSNETYENTSVLITEELNCFWDEYKYRHDLSWRTFYKASFIVVFLAVIPYVRVDLTEDLKWIILIIPGLGVIVAVISWLVINNELKRFEKIKCSYRELQNLLWFNINKCKDNRRFTNDRNFSGGSKVNFKFYVNFLLVGLIFLSVANFFFLAIRWIPCIKSIAECSGSN